MKALSVREPWLFAILHLGKRIENRVWSTKVRGPILLYRAVGMTRREYEQAREFIEHACGHRMPPIGRFKADTQFGGIAGHAMVIDCSFNNPHLDQGDVRVFGHAEWRMRNQYGFELRDVWPLPFQKARGSLGFFEVPEMPDGIVRECPAP